MEDHEALAGLLDRLGLPALSADEQAAVLDLTRVVAHGVQRRFGPLTAYALGLRLAADADPAARAAAVRDATAAVEGSAG